MRPLVDPGTKALRMERMLQVAEGQAQAFLRHSIGKVRPVLWERRGTHQCREVYLGLTDNYLKVVTESDLQLTNCITPALVVGQVGEVAYVRALNSDEG